MTGVVEHLGKTRSLPGRNACTISFLPIARSCMTGVVEQLGNDPVATLYMKGRPSGGSLELI